MNMRERTRELLVLVEVPKWSEKDVLEFVVLVLAEALK